MRKTIDLTKKDIEIVTEYQKRNGLKNFSEGVRYIVRNMDSLRNSSEEKLGDENFALIADAIKVMDEKINILERNIKILVDHTAPKSAGEVK